MRSKAVGIVEFWALRTEATRRIIAKTLKNTIVLPIVTFRGQCADPRRAAATVLSFIRFSGRKLGQRSIGETNALYVAGRS
jgi:hypothetical protein